MNTETRCTASLDSHDARSAVRCGGCGYEWKVDSFVEGMTVEMCIVCGSLTVHSKSPRKNQILSV